jgi:hypothetical protein
MVFILYCLLNFLSKPQEQHAWSANVQLQLESIQSAMQTKLTQATAQWHNEQKQLNAQIAQEQANAKCSEEARQALEKEMGTHLYIKHEQAKRVQGHIDDGNLPRSLSTCLVLNAHIMFWNPESG